MSHLESFFLWLPKTKVTIHQKERKIPSLVDCNFGLCIFNERLILQFINEGGILRQ